MSDEKVLHEFTASDRRNTYKIQSAMKPGRFVLRRASENTISDYYILDRWRYDLADEILRLAAENAELREQIDRLARFFMEHVPGEPREDQGAVDTSIRVIAELRGLLEEALTYEDEASSIGVDGDRAEDLWTRIRRAAGKEEE